MIDCRVSLSYFICSGVERSNAEGLRSCLFLYRYAITEGRRQIGSYIEKNDQCGKRWNKQDDYFALYIILFRLCLAS